LSATPHAFDEHKGGGRSLVPARLVRRRDHEKKRDAGFKFALTGSFLIRGLQTSLVKRKVYIFNSQSIPNPKHRRICGEVRANSEVDRYIYLYTSKKRVVIE